MDRSFAFRIGTRRSKLARQQAEWVGQRLLAAGHHVQYVYVETEADRNQTTPLGAFGMQGVFTKALEEALLSQQMDLAVHSAKDLPAILDSSFVLVAVTERVSVADVLVVPPARKHKVLAGGRLSGCRIGTASARRMAQLNHYFPEAAPVFIRGNIETRLRKLAEGACDALLLAHAAMLRLADINHTDEWIAAALLPSVFVPAAGQGALAIECLHALSGPKKQALRSALNHPTAELAITAERAFLAGIHAGCEVPAFAYARFLKKDQLHLQAGRYQANRCFSAQASKPCASLTDAVALGRQLATTIRTQLPTLPSKKP